VATGRNVLLRIHATAVNRADTLQRKGAYPPPAGESDILGLEAAGEVVQAGSDCSLRIPIGSACMTLLGSGGYAEYVLVDERLLIRIPTGMSFLQAAAIPETWLTAYQLLYLLAGVKKGDKVLVHAAGSGVGLAAIQLAVAAEAEVFAVAGTDEKLALARSLGVAHTVNYKTTPKFSASILEATGGKGVDVILDCIGASFVEENLGSAALDSRWVLYGLMGGRDISGPFLGPILAKRIKLQGTTLRSRTLDYKIQLSNEFAHHSVHAFVDGSFRPVVDRVYPLAEAQQAHEYMESNANTGKIVLSVIPPASPGVDSRVAGSAAGAGSA